MKNKQNEHRRDSQSRLNSLLQKDPLEGSGIVRFDPSVFMKSKVILPDVTKQNINSPSSTTSFSRDSMVALVSTNNLKRVFHSKTLSLANQMPVNDPSFVMQTPTKASLSNAFGIDMSEIASNSDFQTTMYSSIVSSKKREIARLVIFPKQRTTSAHKASPQQSLSKKNSVELDMPQTERPSTSHQKIHTIQENYKKALDSFFCSFDKNRTFDKSITKTKRILGGFSSQPGSPVSKRAEPVETEKVKPHRPLAIRPTETLDFGILKMSETPLSNRAKRNLKKSSTPSNLQAIRGISPQNQYAEESTKMPDSAKIRSDGNIGSQSNSNATGTQSEIPVKRADTSSIPRIELPESQTRIGPHHNQPDFIDNNFIQKKTIVGKVILKKENSNKTIKKLEENNRLTIQQSDSLKLNKQSSIDFSLQISTNPTSQQDVPKIHQIDLTKEANPDSTNTLLSKQGTFDSQNQKNESPKAKTKKPMPSFFAETPKEPESANPESGNAVSSESEKERRLSSDAEKEKRLSEIKMTRRSSFGEVFSLIQKQQQTRRNSSYKNLANASNILQNLFPDMLAKLNDKEHENMTDRKKSNSLKKEGSFTDKKLKIALPQENDMPTSHGFTPKHIKVTTPHNLHIDLGLFSHKNRIEKEKDPNIDKLELEANQSSISPQNVNSPDASKSGFTPLVGFGTPSPVNAKNTLGFPLLGLSGFSPSFSDQSAHLNNIPEPTHKKGKKSFAQVCQQVIDIRRSRKSHFPSAIDTKKGENHTHRDVKEKEIQSAGERKKRRLSRTGDIALSGLPSPPPSSREMSSFRSVPRAAEDLLSGRKKISFLGKESTVKELSLLRSIIKDNEDSANKDHSNIKKTSIFSTGNRLKNPKEPKLMLTKSEPVSLNSSVVDAPSSVTSLQPPPSSRGSISFKKPKFDKTYTQKSVFAKKGEIKQIQCKNFAVKFPMKEGETESTLKLDFKSKDKRLTVNKTQVIPKSFRVERREDLSKAFLGSLNNLNRTNRKGSQISNIDKLKSENFMLSEGPDRQKTIDFSTLLQNDDDDSFKAFPGKSISRTGSNRSDLSKLMTLSARDRDNRENANHKIVIRILAPGSEGNVNLLAKPKGMGDNDDMPEGSKKFEYLTKPKHKKALDAELEFSPFDNPEDIYDYAENDDACMGDSLEITQGFDWTERGKYFSKVEQHGNFMRFYDMLTRKKNPYLAKYYDDNVVQKYINEYFLEDASSIKQLFNKKLVFRLITSTMTKIEDVHRLEGDSQEVVLFKSTLVDKYFDKIEMDSMNQMESFEDDLNFFDLDKLVDERGIPYLRPRARKVLKGPHGHKHLISQIDDRIQSKLFEETGHTIEDYIMLNQVNMKQISRKDAYPQISKILAKLGPKNNEHISMLNFQTYKELFFGNFQCMFYIKTFDTAILQNFLQQNHPNQKALLGSRKIIRNPSLKKLPPRKGSQDTKDPSKKGISLLRSTIEKMNLDRDKRKLGTLKEILDPSDLKVPLDKSGEQISRKKTQKVAGLSLEAPQSNVKSISAPVSPLRSAERSPRIGPRTPRMDPRSPKVDLEDQLNSSRNSIFGYLNRNNEGMKSPSNGILKRIIESKNIDSPNLQPKSLLRKKTLTMNNAHISHQPSRFQKVVLDVMKKKNEEKFKASFDKIPSLTKLNESRVSQMQTPRKANNHIKFDGIKTISTDETKMDKGALRMRTQAQTHSKKKNLTISQQLFLAVKENREAELRELFVFCPLSLLDKSDEYGNNLLGIAAQCGFNTVFEMLLSKSVNINIPNADGNTPLHLALAYGNYDIADKLLALGAFQNIPNKNGKLPWDLAR